MMRLGFVARNVARTSIRPCYLQANNNNFVRLTLTPSRHFATSRKKEPKDSVKEAEYKDIGNLNERENPKSSHKHNKHDHNHDHDYNHDPKHVSHKHEPLHDAELNEREESLKAQKKLNDLSRNMDNLKGIDTEDMKDFQGIDEEALKNIDLNSPEYKKFEEEFKQGKFGDMKDLADSMKRGMTGQGMKGMKGMEGMEGLGGLGGLGGMGGMRGTKGMGGMKGMEGMDPSKMMEGMDPETMMESMRGMKGMEGMEGLGGMGGMKGAEAVDGEVDESDLPEEYRTQSKAGDKPKYTIPESHEVAVGESEKLDFQTETQKILNIVASSLYTEKEVFIRELISNCSDALEKLRHSQLTENKEVTDSELPLEVNIYSDEENKILIIQDSGVGMSKEELITNLGRIGHSGSAEFLKKLSGSDVADKGAIIGQFGVGFYSCFMVATKVKVFSKSAEPGSKGYLWESDGSGTYTIREAEGVSRGTKIVIHLKDNAADFAAPKTVENIVKKYSNFVGVPIKLNGDTVNTIKALWSLPKDKISEEEHKEFYHFIAKAYDTPAYRLHYSTDSPINIRSLLYFPSQHIEKYGMGRMESGVSLFCRKVLIQTKARGIFPEWLRFVKGVVDSEDLSLNISREHLQDSALVQKLSNVLTKRVLKYLDDEAKKDPVKYEKWFEDFGLFLKEGVCTDYKWKEDVAKLLRMDSSHKPEGDLKLTSLDDYLTRMKPGQKEIYYLCVPARDFALNSPYYEAFQEKNFEVLFLYNNIDEFVMTHLNDYKGKKLVSAESAKLDTPEPKSNTSSDSKHALSETQISELTNWMRETLSDRVISVKETKRLSSSPAVIVEHESSSFRKMMKFMDPNRQVDLPKQQLEINPRHPIIIKLAHAQKTHPKMAKTVAEQILDNALVAAGLVDDSRSMLPRLNRLLEMTLEAQDIPDSDSKSK